MNTKELLKKVYDNFSALLFIGIILIFSGKSLVTIGKDFSSFKQEISDKYNSSDSAVNDSGKIRTLSIRSRNLISVIENEFDSYIMLKDKLAKFDANLNYFITGDIRSTQVLYGKNDWFFYKSETDGDSIADYKGNNHLENNELQKIAENITHNRDYFKEKNIQFYLMVLPNKELIYAKYMPDDIIRIDSVSRTDKIVDHLKTHTDVPVVYPKDELLKYIEDYQLYYQYDSHWNQLGAYIAEQQMLSLMNHERSYLDQKVIIEEPLITHASARNELVWMAGMTWYFKNAKEFIIDDSVRVESYDEEKYVNDNAKYNQKILFVGDSFRIALIPHLLTDFSEVNIILRRNYNKEIIDTIKPDIVVLEYVERHSNELSIIDLTE